MNKPYIVCHMMTSVDGRIDCAMTEKLTGVDHYYETLDSFGVPVTVSGRVTAELEMAEPGRFEAKDRTPYEKNGFSLKENTGCWDVVMDSKGTLLWPDQKKEKKPVLVVTSQLVSKEYLDYLDSKHISWIVAGENHIDLKEVVRVLNEAFGVNKLAVVGGGTINGGFLEADLLDEISILMGPGIDGRRGMGAVFDGRSMEKDPVPLRLKSVKAFEDGSLWIRYTKNSD